jgi:putative transposase
MIRMLDRAAVLRGYPHMVRTDKGPKFASRMFIALAQKHGNRHILIQPGRPIQKAYIESFNRKFRNEHLNESWIGTLQQTRNAASIWKQDYNRVRPHTSVGRVSPAEFSLIHQHRAANEGESMNSNLDKP